MFRVYRGDGNTGTPLAPADSIDGVVCLVEIAGVGDYTIFEDGVIPRRWGTLARNKDGTFLLNPDRLADWQAALNRSAPEP
jgi:hypothetical protein